MDKKKMKNTMKMNIFADVKKILKHFKFPRKYKTEKIFNFKPLFTCFSWLMVSKKIPTGFHNG